MKERYHQQLFGVLIPTLEDPEPRVHSHAAAALINFCRGVEHDTLVPYLDLIVKRLLRLLNPGGDQSQVNRYVQEQTITTLTMVADASEATFAESPLDPNSTQLTYYLVSTWAKIGQALGPEFEPYLPLVMPNILSTASAKTDISVYEDDDDEANAELEGWETVTVDERTMGIRTSALEEKCQAFETLLICCSTLREKYTPYLSQKLEICILCINFDFHEGIREASAMLISHLLDTSKSSKTLTPQMVTATFHQLITCICTEPDSSFLASLYKCFSESLQVIGGPSNLPQEYHVGIIDSTKNQLQVLADKRK
ncbi:Importin-5 [Leucoagaricus sp. SymC.cos]|nr:Importin-5 [Leucoagaricus sp. SymC.cos]